MRRQLAALLLALPLAAAGADSAMTAAQLADARAVTTALQQQLQGALQAAMASGGPLAAVATCNEQALPLTAGVGTAHGWQVRRTALRVRNPANTADAFEQEVLQRFASRLAAGEPAAAIEEAAIVTDRDGRQRLRYLKAIPLAEPCAVCHGEAVAAPLQEKIRALYPADAATGFRAGELRGAFSLERRID